MNDLLLEVEKFARTRILVVGDIMLDRYISGAAERVSPEAPVVVLRGDRQEVRLGGAASVAAMLRGLEADVHLAGIVGNDSNGRVVGVLLKDHQIVHDFVVVDESRRTTCKERYLGRAGNRGAHQILRVDFEDRHPIDGHLEQQLLGAVADESAEYAAILVSDYAKGVCTSNFTRCLIGMARARDIPILIDPGRGVDLDRYRGGTLVKPNRIEAEEAMGEYIHLPSDALRMGHELCTRHDIESSVVTLDRDGMAVASRDGTSEIISADLQEVCDITGAGDMVLTILGLCLANGTSVTRAARVATAAARLEVLQEGVAIITRQQLSSELTKDSQGKTGKVVALEQLAGLVNIYRRSGRVIVFTNGCFDLLHVGHASYLKEASLLGDILVVAVNSDTTVRKLKGSSRPIIGQHDRAALVAALSCVDHVVVFDEDTPHRILELLKPDILVKGGSTSEIVGREVVESYGGTVLTLNLVESVSTTRIVARIYDSMKLSCSS